MAGFRALAPKILAERPVLRNSGHSGPLTQGIPSQDTKETCSMSERALEIAMLTAGRGILKSSY